MPVNADEFEKFLMCDDGLAAQQHLAAGRPIYYGDEKYPSGIVRKYPDGRLQLVSINGNCQPSCRLTTCDYAAILSSNSPSAFTFFSAMC